MVYLIFFIFLLFSCTHSASLPIINVYNNKLFVNGQEFIVQGVNYSPTPLGAETMATSGYGGGGFCSSKLTPWGEYKSNCYDSDYYDGSADVDPTRFPNGWLPVWQRDFQWIKALGANTIRLYNTNPSTRAATQQYTNLFPKPTGKDHTQFMNFCAQNGIYVAYPLFSDENAWLTTDERVFKRYLRWQIDEVGNSSALLMWVMGNEMAWTWNYNGNTLWNQTAYNDKHNRYIDYIRRYTISKWNRYIPITTAAVNIVSAFNLQYSYWHVDIFSSNVFGNNFDYLFNGYTDGSFSGVSYLQCAYNKPFLMTELYATASEGLPYTTGTFNLLWYQVWRDIQAGMIGAIWFEQTDEMALGKDSGFFGLAAATATGNQTSLLPDVIIPDNLVMKQQYIDAYEGNYQGYAFNMRESMFTLLNRNPYTMNNSPNICSNYRLYACPGNTLPYCSGNGACDRTKGVCNCAVGWSGADCSVPVCPNSCHGNGVCSALVTPPECVCNAGFYNTSCEVSLTAVAPGTCPNGCSNGNGVCSQVTGSWACACWPGWAGPDCAITDLGTGSISVQQYYLGCYSASTSVNFAFTSPSIPNLTNQKCRYYCALRNYTYSATESGKTCLCDNTVRTLSGNSGTTCASPCIGDAAQMCGGQLQNSVYISGGPLLAGYRGCYADNSATRDLSAQLYSGASNTIDSCRQLCGTHGYLYAGLQSGTSCYCGNTYGSEGGKVDDSQCSTRCSGDSSTYCGGSLRNSIYTTALAVGYNFP